MDALPHNGQPVHRLVSGKVFFCERYALREDLDMEHLVVGLNRVSAMNFCEIRNGFCFYLKELHLILRKC